MNRNDELDVRPVGRTDVGSDVEITAVPTYVDETPETAEIRADIEQTRAEMSETIEALQERLSPSAIKEQAQEQFHDVKEQVKEQVREQFYEAKEMVRAATIGRVENMVQSASDNVNDARYTVMETIRANPIPAALVGIGLSWLYMNRRSTPVRYSGRGGVRGGEYYGNRGDYNVRYDEGRSSYGPQYYEGQRYNAQSFEGQRGFGYSSGSSSQGIVDRAQQTAGNVASSVTGTASNVASSVSDTAGNVVNTVTDTAGNIVSSVSDTASNVASSVSDTASNLAYQAQYRAQRVEDRFEQTLRTNPLAVGAATLALGAAVGLALPQTQRENQLMGETRENLVDRAQEVASDTFEKVQRVATEVTSEVKETAKEVTKEQAREQGLTS